jgi:hypothetical protein
MKLFSFVNRCDDVIELFNYANIKSDQLMAKIEERQINRQYFECIAQTIDHVVDSVCSSITSKSKTIIHIKYQPFFLNSIIMFMY